MVVLQGSLYMTPTPNKARLYKKDTSQKDYLLDLYQVWSFLWPLIFFGASFHSVFIATNCNHPIFLGLFIHDLSTNIQPMFPPSIRGTNSESVRPRYGVEVVVVDTSETFPSSEVTLLSGSGVVVTWWIPWWPVKVQGSSRPLGISEYGSHVIGFPKKSGVYLLANVKTKNEYWTNGIPTH